MPQFDKVRIPDQSNLRDYQKECIDAINKAREVGGAHLVVLPTGAGKCFAPGTKVMMYDGYIKNIEAIREGEQVMGPDGKPRTVVGLTHGFDKMYTIHQSNGEDYTVNSVHILSLRVKGIADGCTVYINNIYDKKLQNGNILNIKIEDYLSLDDDVKQFLFGWKSINDGAETVYSDITISSAGYGEYYGFELVGFDRLFLLEDRTVVHNTFVFTHIPRHGNLLILSHRDELVHQPEKYYINEKVFDEDGNELPTCTFGVEQAGEHSNGEEVVSASVQSLINRLDKFAPDYFDTIIVDECHHSVAASYRKIIDYFKPKLLLGFTATPDRNDKADLHEIFDDIIYMKDMRWGIEHGHLTDIECYQVNCGYNLDDAKIVMGDFHQPTLAAKMMEDDVMDNVIRAYNELRKGQTLVFAVNVDHAYALQKRIPNSVVIEAKTPDRDKILEDFTNRKIDCIISVFVLTEGTDLPLVETVLMARPTKNQSLFCQTLGRGLRPYPGKEACRLIDCVGTSKRKLATVGTLFGIDEGKMPKKAKGKLFGCRVTEMENVIEEALDTPEFWISNKKTLMFKDEHEVDFRYINFIPLVNDSLVITLPEFKVTILPEDALGNTRAVFENKFHQKSTSPEGSLQETIDRVHNLLTMKAVDERVLWDTRLIDTTWGIKEASEKQVELIKSLAKQTGTVLDGINLKRINKRDAGILITRMKNKLAAKQAKKKSYAVNDNPRQIKCKTKYS